MEILLNKLIDNLREGDIFPATLIVIGFLLFNFKKIINFFEEFKKARIIKLSEALKCEQIQGLTKSHLEEELATEYFKISTGIRLEKGFREAIIKAHKDAKGELNFIHFKKSLPHILYKNSKIYVYISIFEWVCFLFNLIFGILLALLSLLLVEFSLLSGQTKGIDFLQIIYIVGQGGFFFVFSLVMLYQTFPVRSARKVKSELNKLHKTANSVEEKNRNADSSR